MHYLGRVKTFLMGRHFVIHTDHQLLENLFESTSAIPTDSSARICRWAIALLSYDYTIKYVKGCDIPHADAISRLKFVGNNDDESCDTVVNAVYFERNILDPDTVKFE